MSATYPSTVAAKLVVTQNESELAGLDELLKRGRVNGIDLIELDATQAREIEPAVKTVERAYFLTHNLSGRSGPGCGIPG